jgi:hypothetical protein
MGNYPGFIGGAYTDRYPQLAADQLINLYPQPVESGTGRSPAGLVGTPGLRQFAGGLAGAVRGLWAGGDLCFCAAGSQLYQVYETGGVKSWGNIDDDQLPVGMFPTQDELFIVSAGKGWRWGGSTVEAVLLGGGSQLEASAGAFLDGHFLAIDPSVSPIRFRRSATFDASTWATLNYAEKEAHGDGLLWMMADHKDLWLWGTDTLEIWRQNYSANPDAFPWEPDPGAFQQIGNVAPYATVQMPRGTGWLAGDTRGEIYALWSQGYNPKRISTHAVEAAWSNYTGKADAEAYVYAEDGHYFWVISFPNDDATWVYDVTTGLWHQRGWWDGATVRRHRSRGHAFVWNKHLVGDFQHGTIYQMSLDLSSDDGVAIHRRRRAPYIVEAEQKIFYHQFQLVADLNVATDFTLAWSDDGAESFVGNLVVNSGAPADDQRIQWRRLGSARHRVFQVSALSSTAKIALVDAHIRATPGAN